MKYQLLLVTVFFYLLSSSVSAQWSSLGNRAAGTDICVTGSMKLAATEDGGAWIGWNCGYQSYIQRVTADGYLLFDSSAVTLTPDSLAVTNILMDILPVEGDELMVAYSNFGLHPNGRMCIYGQRFTAEGERLFDPFDSRVSWTTNGNESGWRRIVTDGNNGFWAFYFRDLSTNLYICGMNADGTKKMRNQRLVGDIGTIYGPEPVPDDSGGVHLAWGSGPGTYYRHMLHTEDFANAQPQLVVDGWSGGYHAVKDRTGGCFVIGSTGGVQHVMYNGDLPWGLEGQDNIDFAHGNSSAVSTPDSGFARAGAYRSGVFLVRINSDYSEYYEDFSILLNNPDEESVDSYVDPILRYDSSSDVFYICYVSIGEVHDYYLTTRKVDGATAENLWDEPVRIGPLTDGSSSGILAVLTSDGSLILSNLFRDHGSMLLLYKIYPDGTLAGSDQAVSPVTPSEMVKSFNLLSTFPNPFNGTVTLRVSLEYPGTYKWSVYSLTGELVSTQHFVASRSGTFEQTWTPSAGLAGGVYFVRWTKSGQHLATTKAVYMP
ncbi:T9SS type A sorting domain-containing protein [bacterium]|nr:T9SS type A sorting domain-containing protein [bacterium]